MALISIGTHHQAVAPVRTLPYYRRNRVVAVVAPANLADLTAELLRNGIAASYIEVAAHEAELQRNANSQHRPSLWSRLFQWRSTAAEEHGHSREYYREALTTGMALVRVSAATPTLHERTQQILGRYSASR
jgi:hypothetical protein